MDGNFKLVHLASAAKSTTHLPPISGRLLDDATVEQFCGQEVTRVGVVQANQCSDFAADDVLGRKKQKYDHTGQIRNHIWLKWGCLVQNLCLPGIKIICMMLIDCALYHHIALPIPSFKKMMSGTICSPFTLCLAYWHTLFTTSVTWSTGKQTTSWGAWVTYLLWICFSWQRSESGCMQVSLAPFAGMGFCLSHWAWSQGNAGPMLL